MSYPNYQMPDNLHYNGSTSAGSLGGLLAKTYALLAATLGVSAIGSFYGMHSDLVEQHPIMMMIGVFALLFIIQFTGARNSPLAVPLVFAFAGGMGAMMGPAIGYYLHMPDGPAIISEALGATAALFIGLSAFAMTTKKDFSHIGGFLLVGLIIAIVVSLLNIFVLHIAALQLAIAGVLVLVFSGLIIFDTQRMIDGGIQNPVLLVVSLYLDIINIFMALLEIFGGSRE